VERFDPLAGNISLYGLRARAILTQKEIGFKTFVQLETEAGRRQGRIAAGAARSSPREGVLERRRVACSERAHG
jgi:hypothetical protein